MSRAARRLGLLCAGLLTVCGCRPAAPLAPATVVRSAERGPLRLEVSAAPAELLVGDPIRLTVRMVAPADVVVQMPEQSALPEIEVTAMSEVAASVLPDGRRSWLREFTLETLSAGELVVPPVVVRYGKQANEPDGVAAVDQELVAESLTLTVRSALTSQDTVTTPREITGTLTPQPRPAPWWTWPLIGAAGGAVLLLGWALLRRWRAALAQPPPALTPEQWALGQLAELEAQRLLEVGDARGFYYRLSEIVRAFIERQVGLAAPDMTTEEFLHAAASSQRSAALDASRLRAFMEACDQVKYARREPAPQDAADALITSRDFVVKSAAAARRMAVLPGEAQPPAAATGAPA